jgi:uncharacterized membrane protein
VLVGGLPVITSGPSHLAERAGWSLVWLAVATIGADVWGDWSGWPGLAFVTPFIVLVGLVGTVMMWTVEDPTTKLWNNLGLAAATGTFAIVGGADIAARQVYSTDSAAFNDVAATLLVHGHNPYTTSLRGVANLLHASSAYWTYLLNGTHVTQVSYPAGAFLLQAPLVALGVHHLSSDWLDLIAWIATIALIFRFLPATLRWVAPLLVLAGTYFFSFADGGTDALFLPFLVAAVWRWDRFVNPQGSRLYAWLSPVALGVACTVKQSPWFCVPFLLLAVALEARVVGASVLRVTARYAAWLAGTFAVINLAFIVWDPAAWWHGVMLPLFSPLIPDGQGLVTLALHGATGGVDLRLLWVSAALLGVTLLGALALWYPQLKRAWLFLVPLVLFVPGRSLSNYLLDFFPVAVIAALSVARPERAPFTLARRARVALVTVPLAATAGVAAWAFLSVPLSVRVDHVATGPGLASFTSITLTVHNDAAHPITPRFMITVAGDHPTGFWPATPSAGHFPLAPGATATVVIRPGSFTWAPHRGAYWLVTAYTSSPDAVATSTPQRWPYGPR